METVARGGRKLESEVRVALERARARVQGFRAGQGGAPAQVLREFDRLLGDLNGVEGFVGLYVSVHPDAAVRSACEALEREIAQFRTEVSLDRGVYDRLAALDPAGLDDEQARRLLAHALRDFRRSGVDRDEATRAELRALQEELVAIGQTFDRNIVEGGREFVIAEGSAGLAGLPPDFLAAHPPRADGSVVLSTDPHDRMAFMTYGERDDLRRDYYLAATNRAVPANLEVLPRLLERRHALATRLGYAHWADYVTEDKMTRSARAARDFLARLVDLVQERARRERDECLEWKRRHGLPAEELFEWERAFLVERIKAEQFDFDSLALRDYFPFEAVQQGILDTAARLFDLEFRRDFQHPVWHDSVQCWQVWGEPGPERPGERVCIGRFFLDLFPREGKYKHAAMFPLTDGLAGEVLPEGALVCNFPEPAVRNGRQDPALLLHDQVTTFFHEFGHLLHHLLAGRGRWLSFAGIATERDFVEVPSQLFEEWAWDPDVLATFAHHVETGEPIPAELVRRLRAAEDYGKGMLTQQQLFYGLLSLSYYDRDPRELDPTAEMIALKRRLTVLPHTEGSHFHASFGHLHGYSAMYYTYLWSLVIAKDLFARFRDDVMDPRAAVEYRRCILEPGGARDAADLVRSFLGREYSFEAFERWLRE